MASSTAYVVGTTAFVKHPQLRGLWIKTDWSAAYIACPEKECGARPGEPCLSPQPNSDKPVSYTHYRRRRAWKRERLKKQPNHQLIVTTISVRNQ